MARNRNIKGSINRKYKRDSKAKFHDKIQRKNGILIFFLAYTYNLQELQEFFFKFTSSSHFILGIFSLYSKFWYLLWKNIY